MKKETNENKKEKGAYWLVSRDFSIDLSLSRNPLGCSKLIRNKVNLKNVDVAEYPDIRKIVEVISCHFSIPKENLAIGAGIDDFINLFPQVFLKKGDCVLMPEITFPRFEIATMTFKGKPVFIPMRNMRINFEAFERILKKRKPKMIFIANPNNPTGLIESKEKILNLAKKTKAIMIVDEAGIDFVGEKYSLVREATKIKNLVVLRGFSKAHGLAGLRIGFCVASPDIIEKFYPTKATFPVSTIAIKAAILAISDKKHIKKTKRLFKEETQFFSNSLQRMGFEVLPPESNLVFAKIPNVFSSAEELINALHKKNIHCVDGKYFGLLKFIRINPATHKINKKFIEAISQIIKEKENNKSL